MSLINEVALILDLVLVFAAASLFAYSIFPTQRRRRSSLSRDREEIAERSALYRLLIPYIERLAVLNQKYLGRKSKRLVTYLDGLQRRLVMAGSPGLLTPWEFFAVKEMAALGAFIIVVLFTTGFSWFVILAPVVGFVYPDMWLRDAIKRRHKEIFRALPYVLDLMTLGVQAGLDLNQALDKVVERSERNALIDELFFTLQEMRLGKSRRDALRDLAERVNMMELTSVVTAIIQALAMGASLGPTLQIQAEQLRQKRSQRAEKLAQEAPVKMLFPLLAFIFPAVFIMLFGPLVLSVFVKK